MYRYRFSLLTLISFSLLFPHPISATPSLPHTTTQTIGLSCPNKSQGDADCDGIVKFADFNLWRREFYGELSSSHGDFNGDTRVTISDFEIWRRGCFAIGTCSGNPMPTSTPAIATPPGPTSTPGSAQAGIWISQQEIMARPTTGSAWTALLTVANSASVTGANIANQDSNHDGETLAAALVCARLNDAAMCTKARAAVVNAIDSENGARWLAVGRNLGAYAIAADILDLRTGNHGTQGTAVQSWLERFYTRTLANNNQGQQEPARASAWASGSNASAQEGFAYAALSAYLGRRDGLDWSWNGFRRYAGDRTSPQQMSSNDLSWQFQPNDIVGIQDAGATKGGCRMDGAIGNDMSRGGTYSCMPTFTQYPWVGLEGAVPAARILDRAGYPAFTIASNAILRTHEYLWDVRQRTGDAAWFDGTRANEVIHLVNKKYGKNFIMNGPTGAGRTVGFTDWIEP